MKDEQTTIINFVARGDSPDEWKLILVEQGPWEQPVQSYLQRLQERLYGCVDAALDGKLIEKFPETHGKRIVIRLDCYNLPRDEVDQFFKTFSDRIFEISDYREALKRSRFVSGISFEITFDSIH